MIERKGIYSIEEVFAHVYSKGQFSRNRDLRKHSFDGDVIKMTSQRYKVFKFKGYVCTACGLVGEYFAKERYEGHNRYHFNLYGHDKNGKEVLLTKDHIIAKANGGSNCLDNMQCMCSPCNSTKGCK